MRLVDFLILVLESHAQTLQRLAALFGEEELIEILEAAGDLPDSKMKVAANPHWFAAPPSSSSGAPYSEIEGCVRDIRLHAILEFHLWAYPYYRAYIESSLDLNSEITESSAPVLVDEAVVKAREWMKTLPIRPEQGMQAETAAHQPWIKFRTTVLKRLGKRPFATV